MDKLVSVNVGLPREIEWEGRVVRTAIWKRPVAGKIMARHLNLDGDGQGDLQGHGGEHRAVMVYQLDSYRYWERNLQRGDFEYGQFGENFTVDGLPDDKVCIGDRYRIGSALFEVTQPRVTCYRVGIRMNNPQMPALLVSHHRPGFYFRVLEEGVIGAGDEIEKVAEGPEGITIAEVDSLLYLPGDHGDQLKRAAKIPALSFGWKQSLEALIAADASGHPTGNAGLTSVTASPPAWQGFRRLRVAAVHQESSSVSSFILEGEDRSALPAPLPGQFLVFRLTTGKDVAPLTRSYSLSGAPDGATYRISVKRGEGVGSRFMIDSVKAGDSLEVSAPRGAFTLAPGTRPVVLLSAGIGVTPVLAMLHALSADSTNRQRHVWWLYGARNGNEHPFANEVRELLRALPPSHSFIAYSNPGSNDHLGQDFDASGRLSISHLQKLSVPTEADFYLCGPTDFLTELSAALRSWGVAEASIHTEVFGPGDSVTPGITNATARPPHPPSGASGTGPRVSFTRSGLSLAWDSRFKSLLEFAEACDVPVKWSCRTGVCHMCECGLLDGSLRYSPEPLDAPAAGNALICCSTPQTEIDLDL